MTLDSQGYSRELVGKHCTYFNPNSPTRNIEQLFHEPELDMK